MSLIPYSRQNITEADVQAVVAALQSDFLTQGPMVPRFEQAVVARCGAQFGVATNSATSSLHLACLALGLGPGDRLWTVPNTFVASANCGRYCGANVDFVDIDPLTWNMSVASLHAKLVQAKATGTLPKVVVPVHFSGQLADQEAIWELAREFNFMIIEDASHAIGAARNGEAAGSCRWSDITVFSFHPVKIITTGEGGMALTNDADLAGRMALLRSHGITREPARMRGDTAGSWYYEQLDLGFNYRMTDIQAALGLSQLERLTEFVARRNALARRYDLLLDNLPLQLPKLMAGTDSAWHLYVVRVGRASARPRREVFERMRDRGVGVNVHYMPVHLQPYYRDLGFAPGHCPEAERHGEEAITLPLYPGLTETEQDRVVAALRESLA